VEGVVSPSPPRLAPRDCDRQPRRWLMGSGHTLKAVRDGRALGGRRALEQTVHAGHRLRRGRAGARVLRAALQSRGSSSLYQLASSGAADKRADEHGEGARRTVDEAIMGAHRAVHDAETEARTET